MKLPSLKNFVVTTIIVYVWVMAARLMIIGAPSAMGALMALIPCSLLALVGLLVVPVSRQPSHAATKQSAQPVRQLTSWELWLGRIWFGAGFDERWVTAQQEDRQWTFSSTGSSDFAHRPMQHDIAQPSMNINGLPMMGCVDIRGNVFGSTRNDL